MARKDQVTEMQNKEVSVIEEAKKRGRPKKGSDTYLIETEMYFGPFFVGLVEPTQPMRFVCRGIVRNHLWHSALQELDLLWH